MKNRITSIKLYDITVNKHVKANIGITIRATE